MPWIPYEKYCCVCGHHINPAEYSHLFDRCAPHSDAPAFRCGSCAYINYKPRWISTRKLLPWWHLGRWFGADWGYYIRAKPEDCLNSDWQDQNRCWVEVERVYETRIDCLPVRHGPLLIWVLL